MRRKMFVMPLAAAMVLSAVPAFASEGTSSAEETVEETSEASSTEESESEGVGDVLANLEGTYEELFPVIADAKYDDLWLGFCAQYGDEENAQLYSDMLKGSTTALIYGAEAVDTYAENPDDTAFDCYFFFLGSKLIKAKPLIGMSMVAFGNEQKSYSVLLHNSFSLY